MTSQLPVPLAPRACLGELLDGGVVEDQPWVDVHLRELAAQREGVEHDAPAVAVAGCKKKTPRGSIPLAWWEKGVNRKRQPRTLELPLLGVAPFFERCVCLFGGAFVLVSGFNCLVCGTEFPKLKVATVTYIPLTFFTKSSPGGKRAPGIHSNLPRPRNETLTWIDLFF